VKVDRDFLFGMLAQHLECVTAEQLHQANVALAAGHDRTLDEVLAAKGWITSTQRSEINGLLDEHLRAHGADYHKALEAIRDAEGEVAGLSNPADLLERTIDSQDAALADRKPTGAGKSSEAGLWSKPHDPAIDNPPGHVAAAEPQPLETIDYQPEQRSRYTLTRVEGEGGYGRVWLAFDPKLKREIALKNLRPEKDTNPEVVQSLIREAQITGQLEHPNIIPIYELEHADDRGKPYYTMRFLRGETLSERIRRYHKRRTAGTEDPLDLPQLLNAFVDVCNALAYAGSRGIVHRDLKPSNIMLGDFGEVLVLDWGLAKKVGVPDSEQAMGDGEKLAITDASKTAFGQIKGTVAYMAPEQAAGRPDLIDEKTDVYGLGAILFAILTGRAPHKAKETGNTSRDTLQMLKRISDGAIPRARSVDTSIPSALDAICTHAMSKERSDRYQTASELARDVQRWLADEPVSVHTESWHERAGRWLRRHHVWARSIAVALILVAAVALVASILVERARRNEAAAHAETERALEAEQHALAEAQTAKDEATERFRQARRAVDEMLTGVSDALVYYPGVQRLRTRLLEKAAQDYEQFAAARSDDPELRLEFVLALVRLGDVRRLLASFPESEQAYGRAITVFQSFLKEDPENVEVQLALARCYNQLGLLHTSVGSDPNVENASDSYTEAERVYKVAADLLSQLVSADPQNADYRRAKAEVLANRGVLLSRNSRYDEGIETLGAAETELQKLADESDEPHDMENLAKSRISMGELLIQVGRNNDAVKRLQEAIETCEKLVRDAPDHPPYLLGLADARITLANALHVMGRSGERETYYRASIDDYMALINTRPDVPLYRARLATTEIDLAQVLSWFGRNDEAKQHGEIALSMSIDLVNSFPNVAEYHVKEVYSSLTLGQVLRDLRDFTLAETAFKRAMDKCETLVERFPEDAVYRRLLGQSKGNLGVVQLLTEAYEPARQSFMDATADFEAAIGLAAKDAFAREGLAWSLKHLGDALRRLDRTDEAKTFYRRTLEERKKATESPEYLYRLAWFLANCEDVEFRDPVEALEIADQISRQNPTNARYLTLVAAADYRQGRWEQCLAKLDEATIVRTRGKDSIDFWRAMALYQKDQQDKEAKGAWDRAVARMDRYAPGDINLLNLRNDVARVLGLAEQRGPGNSDAQVAPE